MRKPTNKKIYKNVLTSCVKCKERGFRGRYVNSWNWNVACLLCFHLQSLLSTRSPYDEFHRLFKTVPKDQFPINGKLKFFLFSWLSYSTFIPSGGATLGFKWQGWSQDFFGFEILDCGIYLGRIIWQVYFWVAWFKKGFKKVVASTVFSILLILSDPVNMDTEGAIESVHINGVSVLSRSNLEKV